MLVGKFEKVYNLLSVDKWGYTTAIKDERWLDQDKFKPNIQRHLYTIILALTHNRFPQSQFQPS